jgi:hypothetical protein
MTYVVPDTLFPCLEDMLKQQSLKGFYRRNAMRKVSIFISIMISLLLTGCTHTESLGKKRTSIGTVSVSRSLDFTDSTFTNKIVVAGDENGNAVFSAQEDSRAIITSLSPSNQKEVLGMLHNSLKLGSTADKEKAEVKRTLGHLRMQYGKYGWPTDLVMQFYASRTGKIWNTSFELCYIMPDEFRKSSDAKTDPCYKKTTLFLNNLSVIQLMNCLDLISFSTQNVTATAGNAQAKVSFSAAVSDGGSAITGYTVTSDPSGGTDVNDGSTALTHTISGLKNGTAYSFSVKASNAAGTGPASSPSNSVTPLDVPGPPVKVTATVDNARAMVSFSAPVSDGGSAITGYTVTSDPSGGTDINDGSTALTHTITGLNNDTAYTFSVQATNSLGIGPFSSPSSSVTPFFVPDAPINVTSTAGNAQAIVSFSAPVKDGGSAITGYTVTSDPSGGTDVNAGSTAMTHTITGLKNGTAYTFSVQASKTKGIGPASSPSNSVTPSDIPGVPTKVTATAGNAQAMVGFSAPVSDGGSAITGYTVTSNPSGGKDVNAGSTAMIHTITGLKNNTAYTFSVQAANIAKTSPASAPSNRVKPFLVPSAPINVTATAGNAQAMVRFSAPVSDGGSAITGYTVTSNPSGGNDVNAGSTAMTHTITGLKNETAYTFSVQASKTNGIGPASSPSNSVTPSDIPGVPTNVTATSGNAQAMVGFSTPVSDGGSAITGYTVTSNPSGGTDVNAGSTAMTHTITGLKNDTAYTFSVQATNFMGISPASSPSNSVTPLDIPGVPTNVTAISGNARAKVSFSAPVSDGGSAITGYTVTSDPSGGTDVNAGSTALTHTITGLKNGTAYTFSAKASKTARTGSASTPSNRVTPFDVPGAPATVTASAGSNAQATVSFSAPVSDGGSAITGYTVTSNPSGGKDVNAGSTATTHTIVGLINGTAYTFSVQAENAAGTGPASSLSNSMIPGHPEKIERKNSTM